MISGMILISVMLITKSGITATHRCPLFCSCNAVTAMCRHVDGLDYIPELPSYITRLIYTGNNLPNVTTDTFINITKLQLVHLTITYNRIQNISKNAFSVLPHLKYIDLSGNSDLGINQVAHAMSDTSIPLRTVVLNSMKWSEEPLQIYKALGVPKFKLKKLQMRSMELRTLNFTAMSEYLPSIECLDLAFNTIKTITTGYMSAITELYLHHNFIELTTEFFGVFPHCLFPNLRKLDFKHNNILYFENRFTCLQKLRILNLGSNPVKWLLNNTFTELNSLEVLSLTNIGSRLYLIENTAFESKTLKRLNFSGNYFNFIPEMESRLYFNADEIFRHVPNLETLNLSENIFEIGNNTILLRMLLPIQKLTSLTIRHCALTTIPIGIFYKLPKLFMLDVSQNHIKTWNGTQVFQNTSTIQVLKLNLNFISIFKETLFPPTLRKNLKQINLAVNPFPCSCKILWLRKWIEENPNIFEQYPEQYRCNSPPELHGTLLKDYFPSDRECEGRNVLVMVATILSLTGIIIIVLASLLYKGRWHIRHAIYLFRLKRKGYEAIEDCTNFLYSGFVVYCEEDREWVLNKFVKLVEMNERKLCIHHRDFEVGKLIIDNIADSIAKSRKVILILSRAMMKSDWCLFELRLANKKFLNREDSLLIIMLEDIPKNEMPSSLHTLLSVATYIEWSNDLVTQEEFWKKVRRAIK